MMEARPGFAEPFEEANHCDDAGADEHWNERRRLPLHGATKTKNPEQLKVALGFESF
jgi:hypothetical protein